MSSSLTWLGSNKAGKQFRGLCLAKDLRQAKSFGVNYQHNFGGILAMGLSERFRSWLKWGHWLDTPQGVALLISVVICWSALVMRSLYFTASLLELPPALSSPGWLYFVAPGLGFLAFVRIGMPSFRSSWPATISVLAVSGLPFFAPYFKP